MCKMLGKHIAVALPQTGRQPASPKAAPTYKSLRPDRDGRPNDRSPKAVDSGPGVGRLATRQRENCRPIHLDCHARYLIGTRLRPLHIGDLPNIVIRTKRLSVELDNHGYFWII